MKNENKNKKQEWTRSTSHISTHFNRFPHDALSALWLTALQMNAQAMSVALSAAVTIVAVRWDRTLKSHLSADLQQSTFLFKCY
jgi:hypothetical protein